MELWNNDDECEKLSFNYIFLFSLQLSPVSFFFEN